MYVIEADDQGKLWISGIFKSKEKLNEYISQIPEHLIAIQNIIELSFTDYPFYIIEKQGYTYFNKHEFLNYLDNYVYDSMDEETIFFNFYFIDADYKPNKPGTDYMGILRHAHVDSNFLNSIRKNEKDI